MSKDVETPPSESLVITREFDAPRDMVFKAWTDAEHLKRWWGPAGCEVGTCKVDLRPGGSFSLQHAHAECYGDVGQVSVS